MFTGRHDSCQAFSLFERISPQLPVCQQKRGVVDKDPLRCYIKLIPQILKVFLTKPYKRLWKNKNQTRFQWFVLHLNYCFNFTDFALLKSPTYVVLCLLHQKYSFSLKKKNSWVRKQCILLRIFGKESTKNLN